MKPVLYALNVGRGDAFFLEIPTDNGVAVILMDGGDHFFHDSVRPYRFVQERGWKQIDLMILTHLHPDHLTGLLEVAEHIPIVEAVLPYPELTLGLGEMRHPKAVQTARMLNDYNQLWELLRRQKTAVTLRQPFGETASWTFGPFMLRHLDPLHISDLPAYSNLQQLCSSHLETEIQEKLLVAFDSSSNRDSSVWLLEQTDGQQLFLFSGDALLSNWERIMENEQLRPSGFKVGHHGMADGWNEDLLRLLSPDWVLITNNNTEYERFRDDWNRIAQASESMLYVTGSQPDTLYLASSLPLAPERIELK
ncbi:ComEC/Rec2 family competence protein [Paenibacillus radicis (ex Xue et al. 2023)]|uniref:MBL fold metallo-hydrolase n=1 Tax=Paenibacillus radicis (ex Xue et al. 2023) TaxID=2972489 RepID=A0ABT1YA37_9BACL|nr:MBL fold metallo-hydrolase [Paenibacillus radicis (ex Xue et al. 2023)]MCR8630066.1 MBL fold metallo-hydrolase [Paenibacillus radicis (ex Xue et al. 2023)]